MALEASDILKKNGLKVTKQRINVLNTMINACQPLSAEQVYRYLTDSGQKLNLSTVYRILDGFVTKKLLSGIILTGSNKMLFEYSQNLHKHHFVCLDCNKILPLAHCPIGEYERKLAKDTGFTIKGHNLDIYGYCSTCAVKH